MQYDKKPPLRGKEFGEFLTKVSSNIWHKDYPRNLNPNFMSGEEGKPMCGFVARCLVSLLTPEDDICAIVSRRENINEPLALQVKEILANVPHVQIGFGGNIGLHVLKGKPKKGKKTFLMLRGVLNPQSGIVTPEGRILEKAFPGEIKLLVLSIVDATEKWQFEWSPIPLERRSLMHVPVGKRLT